MTIVVTRDVAARYRGFLASIMLEVAPGTYVSANLSKGVRERMWTIASDWWAAFPGGSILMVWKETGLCLRALGLPPREFTELDGILLVRRALSLG